ncbi:carotenoid biosynthesis protein [Rufibacter roseus]|uniref:Carotenoid biosynthesis protein n=1 Tax=Rufibacter roseus TaxID=1567108 RepID=A0ABW2DIX9_9BACT|nr:carotenoid biosynthesis protein [Rufibacter roseus]
MRLTAFPASSDVPSRHRYLPLAIGVLLLFYSVGFWGLGFSSYKAWFQALVPFNLLLTYTLLFLFHRSWNRSFYLFAATAWLAGMAFEWVGVHTGLMFGEYVYGSTLGWQLWAVPLLIGVNWLMLVYSSGHLLKRLNIHWFFRAILGAGLMVLLDYFMEPVAVHFDFWQWHHEVIPFSNFIGWFLVALLLQIHFHKASFRKNNAIAHWVFLVQLLFFAGLHLRLLSL